MPLHLHPEEYFHLIYTFYSFFLTVFSYLLSSLGQLIKQHWAHLPAMLFHVAHNNGKVTKEKKYKYLKDLSMLSYQLIIVTYESVEPLPLRTLLSIDIKMSQNAMSSVQTTHLP